MSCRYDAEGMHFTFFADRYVFSRYEMLVRKMVADIISTALRNIVLKGPGPARSVDQMAEVVVLAGAEARNPAGFAVAFPQIRIDPIIQVEWCDDDISDIGVAGRMSGFACELKPDLPETCGKA